MSTPHRAIFAVSDLSEATTYGSIMTLACLINETNLVSKERRTINVRVLYYAKVLIVNSKNPTIFKYRMILNSSLIIPRNANIRSNLYLDLI